ncbi:MAG: inositol monophosphatase family protein [Sulfurifustaceae bacterium]
MRKCEYLETAIEAAAAAADVIKHYYKADSFRVEQKNDRTPVTVADVESEKVIKGVIATKFPAHGFLGEETGRENIENDYVWLVDPIDGTKSFIRQIPFFSTQIALMYRGEFIVGVSNAPVFGELAFAAKDQGAYLNDARLQVSRVAALDEATLSLGNIRTLAGSDRWSHLGNLIQRVNRVRGYGDFSHYHLLASGRLDVVIESDVNILDVAALSVIVREAGGVWTDLAGRPPGLTTTTVLAANSAAMHRAILDVLQTA